MSGILSVPAASGARRQTWVRVTGVLLFLGLVWLWFPFAPAEFSKLERYMNGGTLPAVEVAKSSFDWSQVPRTRPPTWNSAQPLPDRRARSFPRIQYPFGSESSAAAAKRETRRQAVRNVFAKDWQNYRQFAWMRDALNPISGTPKDQFSGWAATLVDSLDALWIFGMRAEFDEAVQAVAQIDFGKSTSPRVNVFETCIRYLGGLLAAYDLSKRPVLLEKATELGDMLYVAFNTESRLPVDFMDFAGAKEGKELRIEEWVVPASPGSLSMEMTRLSQLTGDMKYYDAIAPITQLFNEQQGKTRLPGLWPSWVSMKNKDVSGREDFTMGGGTDSLYEYLPKMYALLGGRGSAYKNMSLDFLKAAEEHLVFRPMLPGQEDILISGNAKVDSNGVKSFDPESEHLTCFIGGTFSLGAKLFGLPAQLETGKKLAKGCGFAYQAFPSGMMPERFNMVPCDPPLASDCPWDEEAWVREREKRPEWKSHLPRGFTTAKDGRYLLRPEAIESLFVNYRITGDPELQDTAWDMFLSIVTASEVEHGHATVLDVTVRSENPKLEDYMESFWLAETLKYFYLIFSPPDLISLDEFVLNTEAHPLRIPVK